jgi:hypothetical protein
MPDMPLDIWMLGFLLLLTVLSYLYVAALRVLP